MDDRIYQIALSQLQGIGPHKAKTLVSYLGSPEAVFTENESSISKIEGIDIAEADKKLAVDIFDQINAK